MSKELSTSRDTGWTLGWAGIKTALVGASLVVMLATNVASLVSSAVHDFLNGGLRKVLLIGGDVFADRALKSSKTSKALVATEDLRINNRRLSDANIRARSDLELAEKKSQALDVKNRELVSEAEGMARTNKKLAVDNDSLISRNRQLASEAEGMANTNKKLITKRASDGQTAKKIASKVRDRATKNLARNTAAIPAEAIPYLGIGVVLSVTAMDIYDACQTAKDFNELLRMLDQGEEKADMCGQKLPTRQEVLREANAKWQSSVEAVVQAAKEMPDISMPETQLPSIGQARSSVCAALKWPLVCQ